MSRLIATQFDGALRFTFMLLARSFWSPSSHLPIPTSTIETSPTPYNPFGKFTGGTLICVPVVSLVFRSHMSITHATTDIRCYLDRGSFGDFDAGRTITHAKE